MYKIKLSIFAIFAAFFISSASAEIDQLSYAYDKNYIESMAWNIVDPSAAIVVPAYTYLRIESAGETSLLVSNGTALFTEAAKTVSIDNMLFFFNSNNYSVQVVPSSHDKNLVFSISEKQNPKWLQYSENIGLKGDSAHVITTPAQHYDFTKIAPEIPLNKEIKGPARIRLKSQVDMQNSLPSESQSYHLNVLLEGKILKEITPFVGLNNSKTSRQGLCLDVAYEDDEQYFYVPEGVHNITIKANRKLLVRLDALPENERTAEQNTDFNDRLKQAENEARDNASEEGALVAFTSLLGEQPWVDDYVLYGKAKDEMQKYLRMQCCFLIKKRHLALGFLVLWRSRRL